MHDPLFIDIQEKLAGYLAGGAALDDFIAWFLGATFDMDDAALPGPLYDLVYGLKLAWAEYTDGVVDRSEGWFRQECGNLLATAQMSFPFDELVGQYAASGSTGQTTVHPMSWQLVSLSVTLPASTG